MGAVGNGGSSGSSGSGGNYGSGGSGGSCTGCRVVGVLRKTQEFSGSWKGVGKIEIKNFAKDVAGEAIKTFGKV